MIARLHYISQEIHGFSHIQLIEQACKYGIQWVQLRVKNKPYTEWLKIALEAKQVCTKYNARLIINDDVAIAKKIGADGVHLGKYDMDPLRARKLMGPKAFIGGTANTIEDILKLVSSSVNYIGLGPYRFTTTKDNLSPILGLEGMSEIMNAVRIELINIPIIAIGGIVPDDVDGIMNTGVHGIAVSSAINQSADKQGVIKALMEKVA